MNWVIALVAVWLVVGTVVGGRWMLRQSPRVPKVDVDADAEADAATLTACPGWTRTTAVVAGLCQSGASRGLVAHRCRVDLLVTPPGAAVATASARVPFAIEVDLRLSQLAWWLPGSTVEVVVDGPAVGGCRPLFAATRDRATCMAGLPVTTARGVPKAVYLKPAERVLPPDARRTTAVIGSIDVRSPSTGTICMVTFGLWVDGEYATTVSDRLRVEQLVALPVGATVAVTVDPTDRLKVVVDADASAADLAARLPSAEQLRAAVAELGLGRRVAVVRTVESGRGQRGVRREFVAVVDVCGADAAAGHSVRVPLMLAVPDAAPVVRGSAVVLDESAHTIDLDATNRARAQCSNRANLAR